MWSNIMGISNSSIIDHQSSTHFLFPQEESRFLALLQEPRRPHYQAFPPRLPLHSPRALASQALYVIFSKAWCHSRTRSVAFLETSVPLQHSHFYPFHRFGVALAHQGIISCLGRG